MSLPRASSRPAAGAIRVGVDVSLANILVFYAAKVVPPDILPDVESLAVIVVAAGLGYLGKVLRDRNNSLGEVL